MLTRAITGASGSSPARPRAEYQRAVRFPHHDDRGDGQSRSLDRTATARHSLSPGYFPFVMATSIISTGTFLLGPSWLSRVLLVIASAVFVVLIVTLTIQLVLFRPSVAADFCHPEGVFGFLAIAAGMDVLGVLLAAAGHPLVTAILAAAAAAVWLVLTYDVPARLLLARSRDSAVGDVNGTRRERHHWPLSYDPALWSVVFPLGMYSVATLTFGKVAHLSFMEPLSRFMLWVALAAWVAVAVAFVVRIRGASGFSFSGNRHGMTGRMEQHQPAEES